MRTCRKITLKQVKVDTILIESDTVASAIRDLIPILNIRMLVVGTTKSSLRYKFRRESVHVASVCAHSWLPLASSSVFFLSIF